MNEERKEITITIINTGETHVAKTYQNEYRNLMVLLKDKLCPEDFGQCGGMGRCGTCLVNISGLANNTGASYRNEQITLSKIEISDRAARLSCQIQIDEDLKNAVVEIFDNVY